MDTVLRRLGLKKSDGRESDVRRQLQKELFAFSEGGDRGFPSKPSCLAYDDKLSLLAVGTRTGHVAIYGRPGVYCSGKHKGDVEVSRVCFLPEQARLITLCSDNSLHLWEYNEKDNKISLDEVKSCEIENSKLKMVSSWCLTTNADHLILGTDGGNVHFFDVSSFSLTEKVIYSDVIVQNAAEDLKGNPGSIEAVLQHPTTADQILIGLSRGLVVLWNTTANKADHIYNTSQLLESVSFNHDGTEFITAHADGSYVTWVTSESAHSKDNPIMPYGPFPCKAITTVAWRSGKTASWTVFAGGMPRANYGDKYTVSVLHGDKNVVLDFSSRVIDFLILSSSGETVESAVDPHTFIVLAEDELVAIDLSIEGWPAYRLPYLANVDARSPVTSAVYVTSISETLWNNIVNAGNKQFTQFSMHEWPITGGQLMEPLAKQPNGLLTGHADGSVSLWDVSLAGGLNLLYTLDTANTFAWDSSVAASAAVGPAEDEWPPFRKVGITRSSVDDPRLAVYKLDFCPASETLLVGGASGQVTVFKIEGTEGERKVDRHVIDITAGTEGFVWNGPEALVVKEDPVAVHAGFQPLCVLQTHPATKCTAVVHHSSGHLIAVATEHGLGVFDLVRSKTVYVNSVSAPSVGLKMSRSRSFQRTLRDSFRQLRRHRSESDHKLDQKTEQKPAEQEQKTDEQKVETTTEKPQEETAVEGETKKDEGVEETKKEEITEKPVESPETSEKIEKIEEEQPKTVTEEKTEIEIIPTTTTDETAKEETAKQGESSSPASPTKAKPTLVKENVTVMATVNSLSFADTVLLHGQNPCVTLWVGTVAGHVLIYQLTVPDAEKRNEDVKCVLAKEIQLKHGAPVIATFVVDRNSHPVHRATKTTGSDTSAQPQQHAGHRVVVCTQQQVKIFALPSLKAHNKYKLAHHDEVDSRFIDAQFADFVSKSDEAYTEPDLVCLTNHGKVYVLSVPNLRLQIPATAVYKVPEDSGAAVHVLAPNGGIYYHVGAELEEFSVSARRNVPRFSVPLKEGMRPVPEPEPEPQAVAAPPAAEETVKDAEKEKTEEVVEVVKTEEIVEPVTGDCEKVVDLSVISNNDSLAAGDVTADSIKVHIKEESSGVVISEGDINSHKVVETMVHSVKVVGGVTEESKTTTVEEIKKIEGMMSTCTVTSSTTSSSSTTKVEGSTTVMSSSVVTSVEG